MQSQVEIYLQREEDSISVYKASSNEMKMNQYILFHNLRVINYNVKYWKHKNKIHNIEGHEPFSKNEHNNCSICSKNLNSYIPENMVYTMIYAKTVKNGNWKNQFKDNTFLMNPIIGLERPLKKTLKKAEYNRHLCECLNKQNLTPAYLQHRTQ